MEASPATYPHSDTPATQALPGLGLATSGQDDFTHLNSVSRQNLPSFEDALRILVGDNTPPEVLAHAFAALTAEQHTTVTGLHQQGQRTADLTFRAQVAINNGGIHQQALCNLFKAYGYEVRLPSIWTRFSLWRKRREAARKAEVAESVHQNRVSFLADLLVKYESGVNLKSYSYANQSANEFNRCLHSMSQDEIQKLQPRLRNPLRLCYITPTYPGS